MTFGEKIKDARKHKKLTQKQLADLIGATHNSVSDWENDKNRPDPDTIELLCGVLDIAPNYLLGKNEDALSPFDRELLDKFHNKLDDTGRSNVIYIMNSEIKRVEQINLLMENKEQINDNAEETNIDMRLINYYYRVASAGTGQIIFDMPPTKRIEIPNTPEYKKVDYAIGVNGTSMEPTFHDGDMLLVEMTEDIEIGDIGIFRVDNESYVKKLGETELISLNPAAKNIPLNETAGCMGKVIGKLP